MTGYELYTGTDELNKVYTHRRLRHDRLDEPGRRETTIKDIKHTGENVFEIDRHATRGV